VIPLNTDKRLTKAYKNAMVQYFDENSKYIFFSDSHRGDDSVSDEFARNQNLFLHALDYYYNNGYIYVEAGDGDELWEYPKFKYIRIAHSDVFTTLKKFYKKQRLIILYGNHNIYLKNIDYVHKNYDHYYDEYEQKTKRLFHGIIPIEALVLKSKNTGQKILIVHGHQGDFINDQFWMISKFLMRNFWRYMHVVGFHNPSSPAKNLVKRHKIERNYNKWIAKHKIMLICGHTHRPKFPKQYELPYYNTGCCINTRGITGIEITDNHIIMVEWRIRSDKEGRLLIERNIKRGPEPIEKYSKKNFIHLHYSSDKNKDDDDNR
jgi:UDP-2,3-diacylglucosamine pyrophosphatase LpxH